MKKEIENIINKGKIKECDKIKIDLSWDSPSPDEIKAFVEKKDV